MPFSTFSPFSMGQFLRNPIPGSSFPTDYNSSSKNSITQNLPTCKEGDLLVALCMIDTSGGGGGVPISSIPSGWSQVNTGFSNTGSGNNNSAVFIFYKNASSTDAAGGATYAWSLGVTRSNSDSCITTMSFANARMGLSTPEPTHCSVTASPAAAINVSVPWTRTYQNSFIVPYACDSGSLMASNSQPSGWSTFTSNYGTGMDLVVWSTLYYDQLLLNGGSCPMSGTFSTSVTCSSTPSAGDTWQGYIEILPAYSAVPVPPSIKDYWVNDYPGQNLAVPGNYIWVGSLPTSRAVGDLAIQILGFDSATSFSSFTPDTGWTMAYSRVTSDPIAIMYKVLNSTDVANGYAQHTISLTGTSATRTYNSHVQTLLISGGVWDTIGTAVTNTAGGGVQPTVTVADNYSLVLAFTVSDSVGNWSSSAENLMIESQDAQSNAPGMGIFYLNYVGAGAFDPGKPFTSGTGGVGATWGICVSISPQ
jgi:hypothetical protein